VTGTGAYVKMECVMEFRAPIKIVGSFDSCEIGFIDR
jgi:hypothetical protein